MAQPNPVSSNAPSVEANPPPDGIPAARCSDPCDPIVKWAGGKRKLAEIIYQRHIKGYGFHHYIEPFCGGAALYLYLAALRETPRLACTEHGWTATLADTCKPLIDCYKAIQLGADKVANYVVGYAEEYNATPYLERNELYVAWRKLFNHRHSLSYYDMAALFLVLNRTCYNGLWRVSELSGFNVPWGKYANPAFPSHGHLGEFAAALDDTHIWCDDYTKVLSARPNTLIYFDPPYDVDADKAQFTKYSGTFGWGEQVALARNAELYARSGAKVIVSNRDTPRVRELYTEAGFSIDAIEVRHSVGAKAERRTNVSELLMVRGPG